MCVANALVPFGSMRDQLMARREEKKIRMLKVAHAAKKFVNSDARGVFLMHEKQRRQDPKPLAPASRFRAPYAAL